MSKDKVIPKFNEAEFNEAVIQYADFKDLEKANKKVIDNLNEGIKLYMNTKEMLEFTHESVTVTLRNTETVKYNEVLLLQYLKQGNFTNCIKTREYVDMDELEKHIYAGALDQAELDKFKDRDFKQALYYKRAKEDTAKDESK